MAKEERASVLVVAEPARHERKPHLPDSRRQQAALLVAQYKSIDRVQMNPIEQHRSQLPPAYFHTHSQVIHNPASAGK